MEPVRYIFGRECTRIVLRRKGEVRAVISGQGKGVLQALMKTFGMTTVTPRCPETESGDSVKMLCTNRRGTCHGQRRGRERDAGRGRALEWWPESRRRCSNFWYGLFRRTSYSRSEEFVLAYVAWAQAGLFEQSPNSDVERECDCKG